MSIMRYFADVKVITLNKKIPPITAG